MRHDIIHLEINLLFARCYLIRKDNTVKPGMTTSQKHVVFNAP
jgi:hypothetical protein